MEFRVLIRYEVISGDVLFRIKIFFVRFWVDGFYWCDKVYVVSWCYFFIFLMISKF